MEDSMSKTFLLCPLPQLCFVIHVFFNTLHGLIDS